MALIADGEDINSVKVTPESRGKSQCWDSQLPGGSAPSSIHSNSSRNSGGSMSDESSVLESINGRTRDRVLASGNDTDKVGRKIQSVELWKLPDNNVDDSDAAFSCMHVEDIQLNETLKSLMETKTPMLPSRLRTAVKHHHFCLPSAAAVVSQKVATCPVGPSGIPTSARVDVPFTLSERLNYSREYDPTQQPRQSVGVDSRSDAVTDCKASMVTEFFNGSYREFSKKSPVQSKHGRCVNLPVPESHVEAVHPVGHNMMVTNSSPYGVQSVPAELSSDIQSSLVASYVPAVAESELLEHSAPVWDAVTSLPLTLPDADSLDSLITRYVNLRDCSTVDRRSAKTSAGQISGSIVESEAISHLTPTGSAVVNLNAVLIKDAANTVNAHHSTTSECMLQPMVVAPHVLQQSADTDSDSHIDRAAAVDVEGDLFNDNFDDIRLNLQNISMESAHTPLHASSQPKGLICNLNL